MIEMLNPPPIPDGRGLIRNAATYLKSRHFIQATCDAAPSLLRLVIEDTGRGIKPEERELIRRALDAADGNRVEAARRLGINRRLRYSKLEEHGIG